MSVAESGCTMFVLKGIRWPSEKACPLDRMDMYTMLASGAVPFEHNSYDSSSELQMNRAGSFVVRAVTPVSILLLSCGNALTGLSSRLPPHLGSWHVSN